METPPQLSGPRGARESQVVTGPQWVTDRRGRCEFADARRHHEYRRTPQTTAHRRERSRATR